MIGNIVFFPYPYVFEGNRYDGVLLDWPPKCVDCNNRQCERDEKGELGVCQYGFNYLRVADNFLISGIMINHHKFDTPARIKNKRSLKSHLIKKDDFDRVVDKAERAIQMYVEEIERLKKQVVEKYIEEKRFEDDFLSELRNDIQKGLSFVHDYKQINTQINQNINVIIETKYNGASLEEKLEKASHEEKAIYWASKFLNEKLNVAKFLIHPEWIGKDSESDIFRFHGLLIKYVKIYQMMFEQKNIKLHVAGSSYKRVYSNSEAIGVVVHTFLDNALKYSKKNSIVEIFTADDETSIYFSVKSFGPKIYDEEMSKIFNPFYRGKVAEKEVEEGAGYGLYIAQQIAHKIGTKIEVFQETKQKEKFGHETTFSIAIPESQ